MQKVALQFNRLKRHYDSAVKTYDEISLLDLAHTLRIWTELKKPLQDVAPEFSNSISFKTGSPTPRVLKAARGSDNVFCYMPGGVVTFASKGHLAQGPGMGPGEGDFSIGVAVKDSGIQVELNKFAFVKIGFDQPLIKALNEEVQKRCTYMQWLGADAVRIGYRNLANNSIYEAHSLSRETIIKRVANTLDASHASVASHDTEPNIYDEPLKRLLQFTVGGVPLPYFILLKIAQDILEVGSKHLPLQPKT